MGKLIVYPIAPGKDENSILCRMLDGTKKEVTLSEIPKDLDIARRNGYPIEVSVKSK